jgi:hypothetical protein
LLREEGVSFQVIKTFMVSNDPDFDAKKNRILAYTPFYGSWLNRIQAQFTALRYFALDGTDHLSHVEQARMIRRYIA